MPSYDRFRDYQTALMPYWLQGPWGTAWAQSFGLVKDAIAEAVTQAAKAGIVSVCPIDALVHVAQDRNIDRGPGETDDAFRVRLQHAWDAWQWAGTDKGIIDQLSVIGLPSHIKRNNQWDWDGHPGNVAPYWARMWVIIDQPSGATASPVCGDGHVCGGGQLCGIGGWDANKVAYTTAVVRKWKSSHAKCVKEIVVISGTLCGDGHTCGDGTLCGGEAAYIEV